MEDVFKRFLIASDPFIFSCRKLLAKPLKSLLIYVIKLLESLSKQTKTVGEYLIVHPIAPPMQVQILKIVILTKLATQNFFNNVV